MKYKIVCFVILGIVIAAAILFFDNSRAPLQMELGEWMLDNDRAGRLEFIDGGIVKVRDFPLAVFNGRSIKGLPNRYSGDGSWEYDASGVKTQIALIVTVDNFGVFAFTIFLVRANVGHIFIGDPDSFPPIVIRK